MRHVERRLVALEAGRGGTAGASSAVLEPDPPKRRYVAPREYPQLVTLEAKPGEELVYGDAAPVIVEWRRANAELMEALRTGTLLRRAVVNERVLELEMAIVEEHGLTLPPASYPWDRSDRRDELRRRRELLRETRAERSRALLRQWLRRAL